MLAGKGKVATYSDLLRIGQFSQPQEAPGRTEIKSQGVDDLGFLEHLYIDGVRKLR